jgi:preprotein translocase subunit YajC
MKPIIINKGAAITEGILDGISGKVVGADAELCLVEIEIEKGTYVSISRDKVSQ